MDEVRDTEKSLAQGFKTRKMTEPGIPSNSLHRCRQTSGAANLRKESSLDLIDFNYKCY